MNELEPVFERTRISNAFRMLCACFMAALCILPGASAAAAATPPMVVVFNMPDGGNDLHLPRTIVPQAEWQRMQDLMTMLSSDAASSLAYLVKPAACGEVADCTELSVTTDERLGEKIGQLHAPQVLIVRPMAGVWAKQQVYYARLEARLVETKPPYTRSRSFTVSYHESECDSACTRIAHRYAAQEFRDMIAYMLALELGSRPKALPPSWQDKPKLKQVSRWANSCVKGVARDRLVRDDRDRAWLGSASVTDSPNINLNLSSLAWTGCT